VGQHRQVRTVARFATRGLRVLKDTMVVPSGPGQKLKGELYCAASCSSTGHYIFPILRLLQGYRFCPPYRGPEYTDVFVWGASSRDKRANWHPDAFSRKNFRELFLLKDQKIVSPPNLARLDAQQKVQGPTGWGMVFSKTTQSTDYDILRLLKGSLLP